MRASAVAIRKTDTLFCIQKKILKVANASFGVCFNIALEYR